MQEPQPQTAITPEQIRDAAAAGLEVLSGVDAARVMALMEKLVVTKLILRSLAAGELVVGMVPKIDTPPAKTPDTGSAGSAPAAPNRKARRSSKHR